MMYNRINLMCPTYKRVVNGRLPAFIESAIDKCSDEMKIVFTFCVNQNDSETLEYFSKFLYGRIHNVSFDLILEHSGRPNLSQLFNMCFERTLFKNEYTAVSMLGDDMVFETKNYDELILGKINAMNGMAVVHCDDGYLQHGKVCVNLFTTRKVIAASGKPFMCTKYPVDWLDNIWKAIAKDLDIECYMDNILIKHNHSTVVGEDETFKRLRAEFIDINGSDKMRMEFSQYISDITNNVRRAGYGQTG